MTARRQRASLGRYHPLKREIHFVAYQGQEPKIVVGYDVYINWAERTGKLDGWTVAVSSSGKDMTATITIYRKDWTHLFVHEVYYVEVAQTSLTWSKSPRFMLKKVAIGQGFRLCFPEELGGLPYMGEEVGVEEGGDQGYVDREDGDKTHVATGEIVSNPRQASAEGPSRDEPTTTNPQEVMCEKCDEMLPVAAANKTRGQYGQALCFKHMLEVKKAQVQAKNSHPESRAGGSTNPPCPICGGEMCDNRAKKTNPKAPDFKCKDRNCTGVIWPEKTFDPKEDVQAIGAVQEVKQMMAKDGVEVYGDPAEWDGLLAQEPQR
jgi:hypothetical protein